MRTLRLLVVVIFAVGATPCAGLAQPVDSTASTAPGFAPLLTTARANTQAAETDLKALEQESAAAPESERAAMRRQLDAARVRAEAAQAVLVALEDAEARWRTQERIRALMAELVAAREALVVADGPASRGRRAELEYQIAALENAAGQRDRAPGTRAFWLVSLAVVFGAGLAVWWALRHVQLAASRSTLDDAAARVQLARAVTIGSMLFVVGVSVVALGFAGYSAVRAPQDGSKTIQFFDMAKWVLGTVLPVVGAWVGGVMAYYFGKENFRAGAENAEKLVKLTQQQKLEASCAERAGLALADFTHLELAEGAKLGELELPKVQAAFRGYQRLPILDHQHQPLACLHLSTLTSYLSKLTDEQRKPAASAMSLRALIDTEKWNPNVSFATVSPSDTLSRVQALLKARRECSDVFVTASGSTDSPVQRWITNDDIVKVAEA